MLLRASGQRSKVKLALRTKAVVLELHNLINKLTQLPVVFQ